MLHCIFSCLWRYTGGGATELVRAAQDKPQKPVLIPRDPRTRTFAAFEGRLWSQCYIYHLIYGAISGGADGRRGRAPHDDGTSQASLQGSRAPLLPLSRVAHPADHLQRMERVLLIHRRPKVRFATEVRNLYFGELLLGLS